MGFSSLKWFHIRIIKQRWQHCESADQKSLKICSKLYFVNVIYKHLPVWNRPDVAPYLKSTGIVVNLNLGSGEDFTLEKLELKKQTKAAATFYMQMPLTLHLMRK